VGVTTVKNQDNCAPDNAEERNSLTTILVVFIDFLSFFLFLFPANVPGQK
jgi:hypothetical protein